MKELTVISISSAAVLICLGMFIGQCTLETNKNRLQVINDATARGCSVIPTNSGGSSSSEMTILCPKDSK